MSARGCYSHHLVNLLATATNITTIENFFSLSPDGSSHSLRDLNERVDSRISSKFSLEHVKMLVAHPPSLNDRYILIKPNRMHVLDYLDNSFSKESNYQFDSWFRERMIKREQIPELLFLEILDFLESNNIHTGNVRNTSMENKVWLVREILSYKIDSIMFTCYERYFMLTYHTKIKTTDFFENFQESFIKLVDQLELKLKLPLEKILEHNYNFVNMQQFNNMQIQCDRYTQAAVVGDRMNNPCISIFDEAYVQSQLRHRGWEVNVTNLNILPNAAELHVMLYPAHLKGQ